MSDTLSDLLAAHIATLTERVERARPKYEAAHYADRMGPADHDACAEYTTAKLALDQAIELARRLDEYTDRIERQVAKVREAARAVLG